MYGISKGIWDQNCSSINWGATCTAEAYKDIEIRPLAKRLMTGMLIYQKWKEDEGTTITVKVN